MFFMRGITRYLAGHVNLLTLPSLCVHDAFISAGHCTKVVPRWVDCTFYPVTANAFLSSSLSIRNDRGLSMKIQGWNGRFLLPLAESSWVEGTALVSSSMWRGDRGRVTGKSRL